MNPSTPERTADPDVSYGDVVCGICGRCVGCECAARVPTEEGALPLPVGDETEALRAQIVQLWKLLDHELLMSKNRALDLEQALARVAGLEAREARLILERDVARKAHNEALAHYEQLEAREASLRDALERTAQWLEKGLVPWMFAAKIARAALEATPPLGGPRTGGKGGLGVPAGKKLDADDIVALDGSSDRAECAHTRETKRVTPRRLADSGEAGS